MSKFANKIIAVTGGGSGLGEAICRRLAIEGAKPMVLDIDETGGNRVADETGGSFFRADVTNPRDMADCFNRIVARFGVLNGAVNNAGIGGGYAPLVEYALETWDKVIATNLTGLFYCMRAEIPHLIAAGGGSIVNMASIVGVIGQANTAAYAATKHGAIGLTKSVALEYGTSGIRVNAVCPTYVRTPLTLSLPLLQSEEVWKEIDARHATGRCATPEEVAAMTLFLLSDDAASCTGAAYMVDAGLTAS